MDDLLLLLVIIYFANSFFAKAENYLNRQWDDLILGPEENRVAFLGRGGRSLIKT